MTDLRTAAQQALEALEKVGLRADARRGCDEAVGILRAALAQQAEPVQEQDVEDDIEAAYWHFDARKKGLNEWAYAPQSERDAFKAEARKLVRGYFPTRQAQDTKREMLAVADAFIRGKRAALAQQDEPVEPVAWMYTGIKQDGTEHGPHLVWKPKYMDAMSASKGAKATPLYAAPPQRKPLTEEPAQKQVTYSTGGLHLEAGFYSEVDLRRMLKALESMNAAARRAMEETK